MHFYGKYFAWLPFSSLSLGVIGGSATANLNFRTCYFQGLLSSYVLMSENVLPFYVYLMKTIRVFLLELIFRNELAKGLKVPNRNRLLLPLTCLLAAEV